MSTRVVMLCSLALLLASSIARGQGKGGAEIERLIGELSAERYEVRERATEALRRQGVAALPLLEAAEQSGDEEVRFRAAAIVHYLRTGPRIEELEAFASQPDAKLDVEEGMWRIARILNPKVKRIDLNVRLDVLALKVREKLGKDVVPRDADPQLVVTALRQVLFEDEGFRGNEEDYTNPDNSSLERVLATRKGLPILLSHVTVAVARRLDVPVVGLPVSGRYMVKYDGSRAPKGFPKGDIVFNPFEGGAIIPNDDPRAATELDTPREALTRMLSNLASALDHDPARAKQLEEVMEMKAALEAWEQAP